jgi:phosphatidylinositol kinase/protein kinase (PI-3  family)
VFAIKDRHNGNVLLDTEGHLIHIDFGFLLGIAPGGSFSIETAPFKLTTEMVEVLGGLDSDMFKEFVNVFTRGFMALQIHAEKILGLVEVMAFQSPYPCFQGQNVDSIIRFLNHRLKKDYDRQLSVINRNDVMQYACMRKQFSIYFALRRDRRI